MLLSEKVMVTCTSRHVNYYLSRGYKVPMKEATKETFRKSGKRYVVDSSKQFEVYVSDLMKGCSVFVDVECDICHTAFSQCYCNYVKAIEKSGYNVCPKCRPIKQKESFLALYGVDSVFKRPDVKEKRLESNRKKFGCDYPFQSQEFKDKVQQANIIKYGVPFYTQTEEYKNKRLETCRRRYGCDYISQVPKIREKAKRTMLERYGVENSIQSEEIKEKLVKAFYEHSSVKTLRQQYYIYTVYNLIRHFELNYPISYYSGDIVDVVNKIDIEVDFNGHFIPINSGKVLEDEFYKRELKRDCCIIDKGYKVLRIISRNNKIPYDEILFNMLKEAERLFDEGFNWVKFDIDESKFYYAGNKFGEEYNFGRLRTLRKYNNQLKFYDVKEV